MTDDEFERMTTPIGVTEAAALAYLMASGWIADPDTPDEATAKRWVNPGNGTDRHRYTRGQAIVKQFRDDYVRTAFVLQHASLELISMMMPTAALNELRLAAIAAARDGGVSN